MASTELMQLLHDKVVADLLKRIEDGTATAADLSVARGLLKDSSITCIPAAGTALGDLEEKLSAKREARETRRKERLRLIQGGGSATPQGSPLPLDYAAAEASMEFILNTKEMG